MRNLGATVLVLVTILTVSCTGSAATLSKSDLVLIGSTPGESAIKSLLSIDAKKHIDFIRWDLRLDTATRQYSLDINFGESQPNTRGFWGGGERRSLNGAYTVSKEPMGEVYRFTSTGMAGTITMVKLSENVFHFLTADGRLMAASNSGWSYTLTRKGRVPGVAGPPTSLDAGLLDERFTEAVFTGRTPCLDFPRTDLEAGPGCLKLKWKLTLYRSPVTNRTTTYRLDSTVSRLKPIEGKWSFVNGTHANPKALLLELDPDKPDRTLRFVVGDENVLYLLDKNLKVLPGNEDFGFALNRSVKAKQE